MDKPPLLGRLKEEILAELNKEEEKYPYMIKKIKMTLGKTYYYSDLRIRDVERLMLYSNREDMDSMDYRFGDYFFPPAKS